MVLPGLAELEDAFAKLEELVQRKDEEISVLKGGIESLHSASASAVKSSSALLQRKDEEILALKYDIQSLRAASAVAIKSSGGSLNCEDGNRSFGTAPTKTGLLFVIDDLLKKAAAATKKETAALKDEFQSLKTALAGLTMEAPNMQVRVRGVFHLKSAPSNLLKCRYFILYTLHLFAILGSKSDILANPLRG
jgi:hypothetical protein